MKTKIFIVLAILFFVASAFLSIALTTNHGFCINKDSSSLTGDCEIGCCTDDQGFKHINYPKARCLEQGGEFVQGKCNNALSCEN